MRKCWKPSLYKFSYLSLFSYVPDNYTRLTTDISSTVHEFSRRGHSLVAAHTRWMQKIMLCKSLNIWHLQWKNLTKQETGKILARDPREPWPVIIYSTELDILIVRQGSFIYSDVLIKSTLVCLLYNKLGASLLPHPCVSRALCVSVL